MKHLRNPFAGLEGYNCFGCSPSNKIGLHLHFTEEGEEIVSHWNPGEDYQGYVNILHGGIQATLMDEIASWTVYVKAKTAGFTSRAEIRYLRPVRTDCGRVTLRSRLLQMRRNLADIEVKLFDDGEQLCAEGMMTFFTFPAAKSTQTMFYPGPEEFYPCEDQSGS
ncbi:MAG TPA: PaaI family thioesterase [Bacteroidales bacterium]|nr:PaaI family thioesterase [Bacteroidales bacterium]